MHMTFLKRALLFAVVPFFSFLLLLLAIDFAVVRSVGDPKQIKDILSENKVYETIIPNLLDQAKETAAKAGNGGELSLGDPAIQAAAKEAFSPQFVETTTETVIDSIFKWLEGGTPLPDFSIDLTQTKATFAGAVAQKAQQRATSLPACPRGGQPSSDDPFKTECLPSGVTPASVGDSARTKMLNNQDFLKDPVITANSIKSEGTDKSIFADQFADAPDYYQRFKASPWLIGLLALGLGAAVVFLSASRRKGLRHVGIILVIVGLGMLVLSWGGNKAVNEQLPKLTLDKGVLQDKVHDLIKDVTQKLNGNFTFFGGAYMALGAAAIAFSLIFRRGGQRVLKKVPTHEPTSIKSDTDDIEGSPKKIKNLKK